MLLQQLWFCLLYTSTTLSRLGGGIGTRGPGEKKIETDRRIIRDRIAQDVYKRQAIRFCLDRVDIFTTQLRAVLRASAYGNIRIMIPMITSVTEVQAVKKIINGICRDLDKKDIKYDKDIKIGVMVETPAAAIMADVLAHEAVSYTHLPADYL